MTVKISENQLVNGHATTLKNELEHSRKVSEETNQRLATTAYDLENLEKVKVKLCNTRILVVFQMWNARMLVNTIVSYFVVDVIFRSWC